MNPTSGLFQAARSHAPGLNLSWRALGTRLLALLLVLGSFPADARWPATRTNVKFELLLPNTATIPFSDGADLFAGRSTDTASNQWGVRVRFLNASTGAEVLVRADMTVYETASCWALHEGSLNRTSDRTFAFTTPTSVCTLQVEVRPAFPNTGVATFFVHVGLSATEEANGLRSPTVKVQP
jgi:hypothetical protein